MTDYKNVLLTGGRDFDDLGLLQLRLIEYRNLIPTMRLVIGYDPNREYPKGLDKMAYETAVVWGVEHLLFPYHYHLGKAGGGSRNQQMLDEGKPVIVLAFPTPNSKGTWDMVRRAKLAGVPVEIFHSEGSRIRY